MATTDQTERFLKTTSYLNDFNGWMRDWQPDAFVTVNLPRSRAAWKGEEYILSRLTRSAEADVLGPRTLKQTDRERRINWLLRREVKDGLVHFHAVVRFPTDRPWRGERPGLDSIDERCSRLQDALRRASTETPECFSAGPNLLYPDIEVRPFEFRRNHARYLLKEMFERGADSADAVSGGLLADSGLVVLPNLARRTTH